MKGLRVPVASVFGQSEGLPALSARSTDFVIVKDAVLPAGDVVVIPLPDEAQAIEISVENDTAAAVVLRFVAAATLSTATPALLDSKGFRRRIPAGAQAIETRAVDEGDVLLLQVSAPVRVTVHAHGFA